MTAHQLAAESTDELEKRHLRYLREELPGRMLVILDGSTPAGAIGYWEIHEAGEKAWETGWSVLPEHHGGGFARLALQELLTVVRVDGRHAEIHAYPSVDDAPSNALCRGAGFTLRETRPFAFRGGELLSNAWVLPL
ncbi:MAG: GNAT family N-acetyltransferase [Actinobacteria bacterium]|nr:GNAT family N-acetyltransferase [Actinomycetota bacterium]